ncbi:hypothetical protein [Endozoicomonas sp. 8E]|uniref:hypothetical protein n=1 Tax=Endozoicomonas sp. 8E TaxID=3035692 RepID=UPI00293918C9|nr:hypothetical protein [Endozoicomonas sp. 8E]WOG27676.1 hypothetical protein P6910_24535 [Endozoicomonas sp. 8E]
MSPWPCHPREGRDPPLALDSRLRGNDDLRAWERVVGVLRQPQIPVKTPDYLDKYHSSNQRKPTRLFECFGFCLRKGMMS